MNTFNFNGGLSNTTVSKNTPVLGLDDMSKIPGLTNINDLADLLVSEHTISGGGISHLPVLKSEPNGSPIFEGNFNTGPTLLPID